MAKPKPLKKVIWSIDPFEQESGMLERMTALVRRFQKDYGVRVEAVYVLSPDQLDLPTVITQTWIEKYRPGAMKALKERLATLKLDGVTPTVLIEKKNSRRASVQSLSVHAKLKNADLILVSSHGRSGLDRVIIGSFAETLLLHAAVPVMIVGPKTETDVDFKRILFPTDFSKASSKAFDYVLRFATSTGGSTDLLHVIPRPAEPVLQSGVYLLGGGWIGVPSLYEQQAEKQKKAAEKWIVKADAAGVPASVEIDEGSDSIVQSIIDHSSKHRHDMIAMSAQSGPVSAAIAGSVTRQVVRFSSVPVLTIRGT